MIYIIHTFHARQDANYEEKKIKQSHEVGWEHRRMEFWNNILTNVFVPLCCIISWLVLGVKINIQVDVIIKIYDCRIREIRNAYKYF